MKYIILVTFIFFVHNSSKAQFYNDGAEVTIQDNAFIHIQGDFINQGGIIFNEGRIEMGGDWINTVDTNPLNLGSGVVLFMSGDHSIGGDFNTLFYNLGLLNDQNVVINSNTGIQNTLDLSNGIIDLNGNVLHLLSPADDVIQNTTGGILAETSDQYGYLRWDIAESNAGNYTVPFINNSGSSIPLSFDVNQSGQGEMGYLLMSTYGTDENNNPLPIDVNNILLGGDESGLSMIDRYWIVEAVDYIDTPIASVGMSYDVGVEDVGANEISIQNLQIVNWNGVDTWEEVDATTVTEGFSETGQLERYGEFALWSNTVTSVIDLDKLVDATVYPNPTSDILKLSFYSQLNDNVRINIYDVNGRIVQSSTHQLVGGNNTINLEVNQLTTGNYSVVLVNENINAVKKFVKQ